MKYIDPFGKEFDNCLPIKIKAMAKPRMIKSDAWKKRPVVLKYWQYKKELLLQLPTDFVMPDHGYHLIFYFLPAAYHSKSIREKMYYTPHRQTPDKDNLEKAFLDCTCENDAYIYHGEVSKWWGEEDEIRLFY